MKSLSYMKVVINGTTRSQAERIAAYLATTTPKNNREIAGVFSPGVTGRAFDGGPPIPLGSVTRSVHRLINSGIARVVDRKPDPLTGAPSVKYVTVDPPEPRQDSLPGLAGRARHE